MGVRFLKIAVIYLAIGVIAGIVIGISHQFQYAPVHAHLSLLGWASLALAGLTYHLYPQAAQTRLARLHFWLHNLGLPVFLAGMFLRIAGQDIADPLLKVGALTTLLGVQLFVVNVICNVRGAESALTTRQSGLSAQAHVPEAR